MHIWIMELIEGYGYISLFILMIVENIFPPIPSEVILPFAGFMTTVTYLSLTGVIIVSTLGCYLGGLVLYCLGRLLTPKRLQSLLDSTLARRLHFQSDNIVKTQRWFEKHGTKAVFFGRLVPMIRSLISIPAGMAQMSFVSYSLYTLLGTLLWNTILISIGRLLSSKWQMIGDYMNRYDLILKGLCVGVIVYYVFKKISQRKKI